MAGMFYRLVQLSMNIIYVGLQTYFKRPDFTSIEQKRGIKNNELYLNFILVTFKNFYQNIHFSYLCVN